MRTRSKIIAWMCVLSFVLSPLVALLLFAEPTKPQRAAASVAVANAVVEVASQRPALPDKPPAPFRSEPMRMELIESAEPVDVEEINWRHYTRSTLKESVETGKPLLVVLGAEWCQPCHQLDDTTFLDREIIELVESSLIAVHIDIDKERELSQSFGVKTIPMCVLINSDDGHTIRRKQVGYQSAEQMREFLKDVDVFPAAAAASGPAGVIHAASQIRDGLEWWRTKIGEGVKVEFRWDRSGAQSFPLLAKGDWSYKAVLGEYGRFRLSAPGAKLAFEPFTTEYTVEDGFPVIKLIGPFPLKGVLADIGFQESAASAAAPAQFGPATIVTIGQVIYGLWQVLHPSCDLQLGGNVSATAVLTGDTLAIDFQQAPSVKLVALFTFMLRVDRVEISDEKVRVLFGGSRLVKERTFKVE